MPSLTTSITHYVAQHSDITPSSDILSRWETRVIPFGLHLQGRAGADRYLGQYGRGIRPPKVIQFARLADIKGCAAMAAGFWEHAYFLETGERAALVVAGSTAAAPGAQLPDPRLREAFGHLPQLLTAVDRETAMRLALQPGFGIQEKKDGERLLARVVGDRVTGGNKKGLTTAVPSGVADDLLRLSDCDTDGEKVDATYHVFDLLSHRGVDLRKLGFLERYHRLVALLAALGDSNVVRLVPLVIDPEGKLRVIAELERAGKEGFVLKDLRAPYQPGEGTTQVKFQFRKSASFIAGAAHPSGRHSVQLFVFRPDGSRRDMGFVTVPGAVALPQPGAVVSVQYLYVHQGPAGKLHQAVFQGLRPVGDADASDCLESKLKVAVEDEA